MNEYFKKRIKKIVFRFVILFLALFIFRFIYGYTKTIDQSSNEISFFQSISEVRKNYASKKYQANASGNQVNTQVDQKYEKVAEIRTKSSKFEAEEKSVRGKVSGFNALIQFEQKSGNKGRRKLDLLIGVPPQNFDSLYHHLTKIGKVQAKQITKKDKTNEYKELNAKQKSLQKIRASLIELKSKQGKINEYVELENRILNIEQQLQELGVSLGDFDNENEFCTIKFSLLEGKEVKIGILQRVKVALEWTVKMYLRMITSLFFITLAAYFFVVIIDKLKVLQRVFEDRD
ncbi:DUF4349 domain-containing protein [Tenacibaculum sp. M341]|uniref:DUF4349 domain-containing protein n=1 Tax=Tenacibaculum sp. M341 TaxID=2530339 RepID=UPI0010445001|nr:DUF4349 domain-containing protein [Tenacibaculum sp. M341]TCI93140.1 DUF4349 domain-containing protein [Tenacibaculum sp. M341]